MSIGIRVLKTGDNLLQPGSLACFGFARHEEKCEAYFEPAAGTGAEFCAGAGADASAAGLADSRCKTRLLLILSGSKLSSLPNTQSNPSTTIMTSAQYVFHGRFFSANGSFIR